MTVQVGDRPILGIALMLGFVITGPLIDVFAKLATASIPVGQIALVRFALQSLFLFPVIWVLGRWITPTGRDLCLYVLRGFLILVSTLLIVGAVKYMPVADAIAIVFVEPLFLTVLGKYVLKETIGWRRMAASAVGFVGCLLVVQPSFEAFGWVAFLPLGTAVAFGFYLLLTRSMTQRIDPLLLQANTGLAAFLLAFPVIFAFYGTGNTVFDPVMPEGRFIWFLLMVGVAATISHIFLSYAIRITPTAVIAPTQYLEIVTAAIVGYFIFNDLLNGLALVGAIIIVASGLYVFWREQITARAAKQSGTLPDTAQAP